MPPPCIFRFFFFCLCLSHNLQSVAILRRYNLQLSKDLDLIFFALKIKMTFKAIKFCSLYATNYSPSFLSLPLLIIVNTLAICKHISTIKYLRTLQLSAILFFGVLYIFFIILTIIAEPFVVIVCICEGYLLRVWRKFGGNTL